MKILITGGCGFLGSNVAASYLESGDEVVVIDALFRKGSELNLKWLEQKGSSGGLVFYRHDIANRAGLEEIVSRHGPFDYVCHLGGQVAMTTSLEYPQRDMLTNVVGTFNLLESIRKHSPEAIIAYSSTNKVYGDLEWLDYGESEKRFTLPAYPDGLDESTPLDFASPYGCSKGSADQYVRDWYRNFGLKTVVFRHSSIYGGRQFATFDQGWIGWFCQKAVEQGRSMKNGEPIQPFTISGTGKQVRDVLHAEDIVRLYRAIPECEDFSGGGIYNIGGGMDNSLSLLELFDLLQDILELPEPLVFERLERRKSDQDFFVADIAKVKAAFGWVPQVTSRDGVSRMLEWVQSNEDSGK
ncbi:MAG: GDP-mannose 4,6-dehydratase [Puniceicoccaceae bacterium]